METFAASLEASYQQQAQHFAKFRGVICKFLGDTAVGPIEVDGADRFALVLAGQSYLFHHEVIDYTPTSYFGVASTVTLYRRKWMPHGDLWTTCGYKMTINVDGNFRAENGPTIFSDEEAVRIWLTLTLFATYDTGPSEPKKPAISTIPVVPNIKGLI